MACTASTVNSKDIFGLWCAGTAVPSCMKQYPLEECCDHGLEMAFGNGSWQPWWEQGLCVTVD